MIRTAVASIWLTARTARALARVLALDAPRDARERTAYGTPKSAPSLGAAGAVRAAAGPRPRLFRPTPSADRRV